MQNKKIILYKLSSFFFFPFFLKELRVAQINKCFIEVGTIFMARQRETYEIADLLGQRLDNLRKQFETLIIEYLHLPHFLTGRDPIE